MMKRLVTLVLSIWCLMACSPVDLPVKNEFQLNSYCLKSYANKEKGINLLVTKPEAVAGFETEEMLYMRKPFQLEAFANNAWVAPPADMLFPLIVRSMQASNYFNAVTTSPYSEEADYRLDTQLLSLEQDFLSKPSSIFLSVKVVLTHIDDNHVVGSKIINIRKPCPTETPYGGVLAANNAVLELTELIVRFVSFRT